MKSYLLQEREYEGRRPCAFAGNKPCYSAWRTIRKEPADEFGGNRAESWLKAPLTGLIQRRIKLARWTLTREEALNSPGQTNQFVNT